MTIALYMNEHIPRPITVGLRIREVDVLTTQEDGREGSEDAPLFDRATELNRTMVSFDADMVREATKRQRDGRHFAGLIFAHPSEQSIGDCIRELELIAKAGEPGDLADQVIFLPPRRSAGGMIVSEHNPRNN